MTPTIELIAERKLIGKKIQTTLSNDRTRELWQSFMPHRNKIKNKVLNNLYSIQVYSSLSTFENFDNNTTFEKWAAVEVDDFVEVEHGMETLVMKGGMYAVFIYKGTASNYYKTWEYIFKQWLPNSGYNLANREHFEVLEEHYNPNDPNAQEEVWIPITPKE